MQIISLFAAITIIEAGLSPLAYSAYSAYPYSLPFGYPYALPSAYPVKTVAPVAAPLVRAVPAPAPFVRALPAVPGVAPAPLVRSAIAPAPFAAPVPAPFAAPVPAPFAAAPVPVAAPFAAAPVPVPVAAAKIDYADAYPQYQYAYNVQDTLTGDSKAQEEVREGDVVKGRYSLIEADGSRRTVNYYADPLNGFNAVVQKELPVVAAPVVKAAPAIVSV